MESEFYRPSKFIVPQNSNTTAPISCSVVLNERMTSSDWHQDVRHIVLRPLGDKVTIQYTSGDIAMVYPTNIFDIDKFASSMGYDPNMTFHLTSTTSSVPPLFPTPCTIRHALKYYLNILGVPTRRTVELLSFFCTNQEEKEKLIEIGRAPDGADLYHVNQHLMNL
jgi:sulfite reductase alpha subunit-like flavoprotein